MEIKQQGPTDANCSGFFSKFSDPRSLGFGPWIPGDYEHSGHYQTQLKFCLVTHQRMLSNSLMLPTRKNLLLITKLFGDQGRIWQTLFKTFLNQMMIFYAEIFLSYFSQSFKTICLCVSNCFCQDNKTKLIKQITE